MPAALAVLGLSLSVGLTASSIATLPPALAARAARSIGDGYIVASELGGAQGTALIEAGKAAYTQTHSVLLSTSAVLILSVVVYIDFASYRKPAGAPAH